MIKKIKMLVGTNKNEKQEYINDRYNNKQVIILSKDNVREQIALKYGLSYYETLLIPNDFDNGTDEYIKAVKTYGNIEETKNNNSNVPSCFHELGKINKEINDEFKKIKKDFLLRNNDNKTIIIDTINIDEKSRIDILKELDIESKEVEIIDFMEKTIKVNSKNKFEAVLIKAYDKNKIEKIQIPGDIETVLIKYQSPKKDSCKYKSIKKNKVQLILKVKKTIIKNIKNLF